jgi:peptidoglycan/LPS O-acetylase OafA/YrhL
VKHRLVHLDCLRASAALLVVVEHLRAFLFVPFAQLKAPGIFVKGFYLVTGLGHQAVMIFFVLSGYLVGGSVIAALQSGKWSWREYLLRRMSRLWVVLIPALLLTLFWDKLGYAHAPTGYEGAYREIYNSGPTPTGPAEWTLAGFVGNAFFLQTILVPCFGTNSPLWSLANEFWYYLLFPLGLTIIVARTWKARILAIILVALTVLFLPKQILLGGVIWLLGAIVYFLIRREGFDRIANHPLCLMLGLALTLGSLLASRTGRVGIGGEGADLVIGIGCAVLVSGLASRSSHNLLYGQLSAGMSEISYTLYLVHFPVLACLFFVLFHGKQMVPSLLTSLWFAGILGLTIVYSIVVWWLFERNTDRVRKWVHARIFK